MIDIAEKLFNSEDCIKIDRDLISKVGLKQALVYGTIKKMTETHEVITYKELIDELLFLGDKTMTRRMKDLEDGNYITVRQYTVYERMAMIMTKHLEGLGIGDEICPCCGARTVTLHYHHYPIPKHLGGREVVPLCPGCHFEFHHLGAVKVIALQEVV